MNYTEFYANTKRRINEALLSMWASGQKDTQKYLEAIFAEESIVAEPVFQSMFPWESSKQTFEEYKGVFDDAFINALDGISGDGEKYRFPKDRKPYTHQSESWEQLLKEKKSIVVTSGTGSGKTECFMMPIIQDLMRQQNDNYGKDKKGGVQAIFLYPLNALMSSQQKRMSAWCKAVSPNVTFAMYKGDTKENHKAEDRNELPELVSREQIRKTPPQILFTNPTMLEYMLVRKQDKPILEISNAKKSLRWIVLDEAHTYSGSSAAELALQIRRILNAFGVTVNDVRFAATSATLGSGKDDEYKEFIAKVTGKKPEDIVVIHGAQVIPSIESSKLEVITNKLNDNFKGKFTLTSKGLSELRKDLKENTLSATEIAKYFTLPKVNLSIEDCLQLIDKLSEKDESLLSSTDKRGALLPTRAHFFVRNMGGLYACVNPECSKHKDIRIDLGALTTIKQLECNGCGSKLIEVNRCNTCGNLLLVREERNGIYGFPTYEQQSLMEIDSDETSQDEETENTFNEALSFVLAKGVKEAPIANSDLVQYNVVDGKLEMGKGNFVQCYKENGTIVCPHCGERTDKLHSLHTGSLFSRLLASTLLEQAQPEKDIENKEDVLWEGRKYISFTDNRQGTAKSTFQQNIEVERNWIRTAIYHYLSDQRRLTITSSQVLTDKEEKELEMLKQYQLNPTRIKELESKKNGNPNPLNPHKTFVDFSNSIIES